MHKKGNISLLQFTILVALYIIGASILVVPSALASNAKQDAWITAILGVAAASLFILLYHALSRLFPDMTLSELNEAILGNWIGKAVSLLYFSFFFLHAAGLVRVIGDFMTIQIMPETPIQSIQIMFVLIVIMGVRLGMESLARAAEIFFPWIIFLFLVFTITISPQIEFLKIQPILENGMKPVFSGTIQFLTLPFVQLVIFLMLYPSVNRKKEVKKSFLLGLWISGFVLIGVTFLSVVVLGPDITARQAYPSYILAKKINVADFLTRVEVIMAGIWFVSIFFKISIVFYASTIILQQTLKLQDYRFLTFPLGMILIVLAIINYENTAEFKTYINTVYIPYSYTYGLVIPLILLVVALIRKKGKNHYFP